MSGITLHIDAKPVETLLRESAGNARDLTRPMRATGELVLDSVKGNFARERSPAGVPWKKSQRVLKHGGQTLQDTRAMYNSLNTRATRTTSEVGTPMEYAAIHQLGGVIRQRPRQQKVGFKTFKRGPRKGRTLFSTLAKADAVRTLNMRERTIHMPARPFLGVKDSDWPKIEQIFIRHLTGGADA